MAESNIEIDPGNFEISSVFAKNGKVLFGLKHNIGLTDHLLKSYSLLTTGSISTGLLYQTSAVLTDLQGYPSAITKADLVAYFVVGTSKGNILMLDPTTLAFEAGHTRIENILNKVSQLTILEGRTLIAAVFDFDKKIEILRDPLFKRCSHTCLNNNCTDYNYSSKDCIDGCKLPYFLSSDLSCGCKNQSYDTYYESNAATQTCQSCSSSCLECDTSASMCTKCFTNYVLNTKKNCECPTKNGFFISLTGSCLACDSTCQTCSSAAPNQCLSCPDGKSLSIMNVCLGEVVEKGKEITVKNIFFSKKSTKISILFSEKIAAINPDIFTHSMITDKYTSEEIIPSSINIGESRYLDITLNLTKNYNKATY